MDTETGFLPDIIDELTRIDLGNRGVEADTPFLLKFQSRYNDILKYHLINNNNNNNNNVRTRCKRLCTFK